MLKEVFRKRDLLGVCLAVLGAAMVVLSSNAQETAVRNMKQAAAVVNKTNATFLKQLSPELIMEALTQTQSIIYFAITGIAIAVLSGLSPMYGSRSIMIDLGLVAIYGKRLVQPFCLAYIN